MGLELVTAKSPLWWTQWEMLEQIRQSEMCPWIPCKEGQTNLPTQLFSLSACIPCYFSNESCLAIGITRIFGDTNRQLVRGLLAPLGQRNCSGDILWNHCKVRMHTPRNTQQCLPATKLPPLQPWGRAGSFLSSCTGMLEALSPPGEGWTVWEKPATISKHLKHPHSLKGDVLKWCC